MIDISISSPTSLIFTDGSSKSIGINTHCQCYDTPFQKKPDKLRVRKHQHFPYTIMSNGTNRNVLTVATVSVIGGLVAYAVYFDYKRRNDVTFRKQLRALFY